MSVPLTDNGNDNQSGGSVFLIALRAGVLFIVLCGIVYPLVSTGLAQLLFPAQANGSLLKDKDGHVVGSELIGQNFTDLSYFQGRVSSIEYKAEASGSNNYAPSNPDMLARMKASNEQWQKDNPDVPLAQLPLALVTNSGSGLDPDITPQSALVQIPRISKLTGISAQELESLVNEHTIDRDLGIFGDKRINVLKLNLALSELKK
ncbi:potassium-transporting ATPase subunit KdpC [Paenibacillus nasutitermitis]|uniref:Potassium-transporting ATPase KdpC subunit n=1 Tax=Paenibacillus nasutitermitis TaxID=1652958 RepID=A0A916YNN6_9BACL|nr:potassium-transporting ATPase subunit KdpC [Paenibacillus nasutitermitis]GGD53389.1 potassium-transporting ATPase KdpC subunit [Paenibacillus nasutitermitis]